MYLWLTWLTPASSVAAPGTDAGTADADPQASTPQAAAPASRAATSPAVAATAAKSAPVVPPALFPLGVGWMLSLDAPPVAAPAIDDLNVYVPLKTGKIVGVSLETGAVRWAVDATTAMPVAADAGRVFVTTAGALDALARGDGATLWRKPLGDTPLATAPVAKAGWVILGFENGDVRALSGETGETVWQMNVRNAVRVPPQIDGEVVYVAASNLLVALTITDGKPRWEQTLSADISAVGVGSGFVFAGARDRSLYALKDTNGREHWRYRIGGEVIGVPVTDHQAVYASMLDNTIRAFTLNNGAQIWREALPFRPIGGVTVTDTVAVVSPHAPSLRGYAAKNGDRAGGFVLPAKEAAVLAAEPRFVKSTLWVDDGFVMLTRLGELALVRRQTAQVVTPIAVWPGFLLPAPTPPPVAPGSAARLQP